jgi:hypothetical protein
MPTPSRGLCITAYVPAFAKGALVYGAQIMSGTITSAHIKDGTVIAADIAAGSVTSAKLGAAAVTSAKIGAAAVTNAKMKAAFLSGTIVSGKITRAIAHGLGVKPKSVIVVPIHTLAQAISATPLNLSLAAASAATSTNIYVIGNQPANAAMKYAAYVQI